MSKFKHYRLSKVTSMYNEEKIDHPLVGSYYTFNPESLEIGRKLMFKDVDHTFGFHDEGEILDSRTQIIRRREYLVLSTKLNNYYLTEYQRQG